MQGEVLSVGNSFGDISCATISFATNKANACLSSFHLFITLASRTFTSNAGFNLGFFIVRKKLTTSFSFTLILFKNKSC